MTTKAIEILISPRRRGWIFVTALFATVMFSWASVRRLSDLVDVQQLPNDIPSHSLFELAEQNIASHLRFSHTTGMQPLHL